VLNLLIIGMVGAFIAGYAGRAILRSKSRRKLTQALDYQDASQARLALDALRQPGGALPPALRGAEVRVLILEERIEEAKTSLETLLATQMTPTEQIRARADLAWLLARLEQPAAATETAQSVLASTVADAECLEVAGLALLIAGQAQTAIDALRRALD